YKSTGSRYPIKMGNQFFNGRIRGVLKLDNNTDNNPIAVGDWVECTFENESDKLMNITYIYPRDNCIARSSIQNKNNQQILAANIDQSLLIVSVKNPITPLGLIDRFLISNELFHIKPLIIFNKLDIYSDKEYQIFINLKSMYNQVGYEVFGVSVKTLDGLHEIIQILQNKTTLLCGQSGTGKTSFINALFKNNLRTKEVSENTGKGMHTTTFAEMFDIGENAAIIDTPGIKELGLVNIEQAELSQYFPEMRPLLTHCKFNNCLHINEPNCAIKEAVNKNTIPLKRYESYLFMFDSILKKKY
ncbi:MAG: ribosome small subunit-dependent GTPase A, partial [Sediminibacterium sp.]|nr:ribosome small subunit-dependent GTPase A [Sediminibacterium sp.]